MVAYLGEMDAAGRLDIHQQAAGAAAIAQRGLFQDIEPQWVEVDLKRIAIERKRAFGGPWLGLELCRQVGLVDFLEQTLPTGREEISWPVMAQILMLARLCEPSSELQIAERFYEASALSDLLGVPANKVNGDRLYRSLDRLLPHKEELEKHLKNCSIWTTTCCCTTSPVRTSKARPSGTNWLSGVIRAITAPTASR